MDSTVTCTSSNQRADVYEAALSWNIVHFNNRHRYSKVFELTLPKSETKLKFVVEINSSERNYRRASLPVYKFICSDKSQFDKWQLTHMVVIRSKFGHVIDARRGFSKLILDQSHRSRYFIHDGNVFRCLRDRELTILFDVSIKRAQLPNDEQLKGSQLIKNLAMLSKLTLVDNTAAAKEAAAAGDEALGIAADAGTQALELSKEPDTATPKELAESVKSEAGMMVQGNLNEDPEAAKKGQENSEFTVKQEPADSTYDPDHKATDMSTVDDVKLEETISEGTDLVAVLTESLEQLNLTTVKEELQPVETMDSGAEDQPIKSQEEPNEVLESSIGPKDVDQDNLNAGQEAETTPDEAKAATQIQPEVPLINIQEVVEISDNSTEVEKSEDLEQHGIVNAPKGPQAPAESTEKSPQSTVQQSPQSAKRANKSSDKKSKKAKSSPRMKNPEAIKNGVPHGGAEPATAIEATKMKDGE